MAKKTGNYLIPWSVDGKGVARQGTGYRAGKVELKPNDEFETALVFVKFSKSYSGNDAVVLKEASSEAHFTMQLKEFAEIINKTVMVQGSVIGRFKFRKQGNSFFIVPVSIY